jgi:hypothetical protein
MASAASLRMRRSRLQAPVWANSARQLPRNSRPCAPVRSWIGNRARSTNRPGSNALSVIGCLLPRRPVLQAAIVTAGIARRQLVLRTAITPPGAATIPRRAGWIRIPASDNGWVPGNPWAGAGRPICCRRYPRRSGRGTRLRGHGLRSVSRSARLPATARAAE